MGSFRCEPRALAMWRAGALRFKRTGAATVAAAAANQIELARSL